jgi:hypothetical protein
MKVWFAAALAVTGCGASRSPAEPAARTLRAEADIRSAAPPSEASRGARIPRWEYRPARVDTPVDHLLFDDGRCLVITGNGQRWLTEPSGASRCSGAAKPSSFVPANEDGSPSPFVAALRVGGLGFGFADARGTLHVATDPLGPFVRTIDPPEPLLRVTGSATTVLATTHSGRLLRLSSEGAWQQALAADLPIVEVVAGSRHRALALSLPENLLISEDDGATWRSAGAPTIGAQSLAHTGSGELTALGLFDAVVLGEGSPPSFARVPRAAPECDAGTIDPEPSASATAVVEGRASLENDYYVEVLSPKSEGQPYALVSGTLGGRLTSTALPALSTCGAVKIASAGDRIVAACIATHDDKFVATVLESVDRMAPWTARASLAVADPGSLRLATNARGSILVTNACVPHPNRSCEPRAPLWLHDERSDRSAAPALLDSAASPAFSRDGRSAYFLGRRTKDGRLSLFVSHDAGASFAERTLSLDEVATSPPKRVPDIVTVDEEDPEPEIENAGLMVPSQGLALSPSSDGAVGITLYSDHGLRIGFVDEDGRGFQSNRAPSMLTGIVGRRALAVEPAQGGLAWESDDGGADFGRIRGFPAMQLDARDIEAVVCSDAGCLVGPSTTRVGWGATADVPDEPSASRVVAVSPPNVRTPIVCNVDPTASWSRIDHVTNAITKDGFPDLTEIGRGRALWTVLVRDPKSGAMSVRAAPYGATRSPALETHGLTPKAPRGERFVEHISRQIEGYAVARKRPSPRGETHVDLAWQDWFASTSEHKRASLKNAGGAQVDAPSGELDALLSVSRGGLFVRESAHSPETIWLEPAGLRERFASPIWPSEGPGGALEITLSELARIDHRNVAVGLLRQSVALLGHQPADGGPFRFEATSLGPRAGADGCLWNVQPQWSYAAKTLGLAVLGSTEDGAAGFSYFAPLNSSGSIGPAVPLATPLDLGSAPRPCTPSERETTPRVLAIDADVVDDDRGRSTRMRFMGTRHPVLIPPDTVLLTDARVIHGTRASPCVAAWSASGVAGARESAVISGDLSYGFQFRAVTEARAEPTDPPSVSFEVRRLSCALDASVPVPPSVLSEPGVEAPATLARSTRP